jgi:hypothetical protein
MVLDMLILLGFGFGGILALNRLPVNLPVGDGRKSATGCSFDGE